MPFSLFAVARAHAEIYPLCPVGGLFFIGVGAGIVAGSLAMERRNGFLIGGGALAMAAIMGLAGIVARGLPLPTHGQVAWLVAPIGFEIVAVRPVVHALRPRGERAVTLGVLTLVGFHLLPMAPAFGAWIAALGALAMANAGIAALTPRLPLRAVWLIDGSLKLCAGLAFLAGSPIFQRS